MDTVRETYSISVDLDLYNTIGPKMGILITLLCYNCVVHKLLGFWEQHGPRLTCINSIRHRNIVFLLVLFFRTFNKCQFKLDSVLL